MKRIVSLWSPDWPITVWMRPDRWSANPASRPPENAPFALVDKGAHGLTLSALNGVAQAAGLCRGQSHADACAILPALISAPAEPEHDLAALSRLALWAERFSPSVTVDARVAGYEGLLIDMTGGAHLFGGEASLLAEIRRRLEAAGIPARLAIADTPAAAWALARFTAAQDVIAPAGQTREALAGLPVEGLRLEPEALTLLKRFGLRRIGDLYGLPRAGLARRFRGPEGLRVVERLDQALGILAEALEPERPAPLYRIWTPFAEPVTDISGVEFHLLRLARALCNQLARDGQGARRLSLIGFRVDGRVTSIEAGLSAPTAKPEHLLRLLKEKGLDKLDLGFGIDALMLRADKAERLVAKQPEIKTLSPILHGGEGRVRGFAPPPPTSPAKLGAPIEPLTLPSPRKRGEDLCDDLAALIDRLQARLGEAAVRQPRPRQSWVPERSERWALAEPNPPAGDFNPDRPRPILLLERPEPIQTLAGIPESLPIHFTWRRVSRRVVKADGPERLSAEWWRADPRAAHPERTRDYYRVEDEDGRRYWLYREGLYDREDADQRPSWWLHGVFA